MPPGGARPSLLEWDMKPIETITFVVNASKPGAGTVAESLAQVARERGVDVRVTQDYPLARDALAGRDLCCAIGGDGTLLGVLEAALASGAAVLGINLGKLGFLATFTEAEAADDLPRLIAGNYAIFERTVLECRTPGGMRATALNDVVIKETEGRGLVRLRVFAGANRVSEYHCDGLIFSTPTGSTAYNLSAGGPIVDPGVNAIAMTPICPHTFGNRSVIFNKDTVIRVETGEPGPCPRISVDGRVCFGTGDLFPLEIRVSDRRFRLMQNPDHSHFAIVRDKLKWGDPAVRE